MTRKRRSRPIGSRLKMNKLDGILLMPHTATDPVELESRLTAAITSSVDWILWRSSDGDVHNR
jgi:hypothetical protein